MSITASVSTSITATTSSFASNTSSSSTSKTSSFCLDCGFDFGHIVDGIPDKTAGLLLVFLVIFIIGTLSFLLGCTFCSTTPYKKIMQNEDENNTPDKK